MSLLLKRNEDISFQQEVTLLGGNLHGSEILRVPNIQSLNKGETGDRMLLCGDVVQRTVLFPEVETEARNFLAQRQCCHLHTGNITSFPRDLS